jgi:hypothetical protein
MINIKNFIQLQNAVISGGESIFSLKDTWDVFRPYLNEPIVEESLTDCLGFDSVEEWKEEGEPPWTYTRSDYWCMVIDDLIEADIEFKSEKKLLFDSMFCINGDDEEDDLWDDFYQLDAYRELENRYYEKYQPKEGELEWYQWKHACFYIAPFTATLLQTAIPEVDAIFIMTSKTHSVAGFIKNNTIFYADILIEWNSVKDLHDFMGEVKEVKFLALDSELGKKAA